MTVSAGGTWTYSNSKSSIWEVKAISFSPNNGQFSQSIVCGTNYGKPCTAGSWTLPQNLGLTGCLMVQIDYNGGSCNSKDPNFCFT